MTGDKASGVSALVSNTDVRVAEAVAIRHLGVNTVNPGFPTSGAFAIKVSRQHRQQSLTTGVVGS